MMNHLAVIAVADFITAVPSTHSFIPTQFEKNCG